MKKHQRNFEFIFYVLGLIGILITIHLYIMENRGFDRGCLGFTISPAIEAGFDCESVLDSEMGMILGIPNVYWGMSFYFFLVFLHIILFFGRSSYQKWLRILRASTIGIGFFYSVFLVYYQKTVLDEYCALCLMSASTILLLSITQIVYSIRFSFSTEFAPSVPRKTVIVFAAMTAIIMASDFIYFNNQESGKIVEETPIATVTQKETNKPPVFTGLSSTLPSSSVDCRYDEEKPLIGNYRNLINEFDYKTGNSGAENLVMEIFDPNCLHCKRLSTVVNEAVIKYYKDAYFVFKPIPLWSYSIIQIQALYISAESGMFIEMLDEQFARQTPGKGLSLNDLKEIAYQLGLDGNLLVQRIQNNEYRDYIFNEHKKTRAAGIKSAPTLMINGKIIEVKSRTIQCLGELIRQ